MNDRKTSLVLPGRPMTKKTHNQVLRNKRTGRSKFAPSGQFRRYQEQCLWYLRANYHGPTGLRQVNLRAWYFLPNRRSWPDLVGLLQATCDILQAAGIVVDDREVVGFDGSRIVGVDKANPRAEITLTPFD